MRKKRSLRKSETRLIDNAVGKVKNELLYYLNDEYDWFWRLESDVIKDYQHYFRESNSNNLKEIFEKHTNKKRNTKLARKTQLRKKTNFF